MSSIPTQPFTLRGSDAVLHDAHGGADSHAAPAVRAEAMQRVGKGMILAGFVITILGVVLYSLACFAGGIDASMGDILFRNSVPFARATLGVLGFGTLVWLAGSFTYLKGAMDADENADL